MRQTKKWIAIAVAAACFAACRKDVRPSQTGEETSVETLSEKNSAEKYGSGHGWVYTLSNQADGNKVLAYSRSGDGMLTFAGSQSTGGNGTGSGLGSQGALIKTDDDKILLTVNAGSNTISSFKVSKNGLDLIATISSGGIKPISITQHGKQVFVLNAGGNGNISGFWLNDHGKLTPISNSTRDLSSSASGPAQISFVNDGKALVVTEKATNKIITYTVNHFGNPGDFHFITSANPTPFGFAVGHSGKIYVSEAAGGAAGASTVSSYQVNYDGTIHLIEGPVSAGQTAACWVVLTDNEKYIYATNTGSSNISSFMANYSGSIDVLNAIAATSGAGPIDAALSDYSRFLYVLSAGSHSIDAYSIGDNGDLSNIQTVTGLPAGAAGLAAE
jgi:6-phosphogluconolactonase